MAFLNRSIASVYIAYALQTTAQAISWQYVTYFVKHELSSSSFLEQSLAFACPAIVTMIMTNVWGSLSDRWKKRKMFMVIGFAGYATTFLFYAFVADIFQYLFVAAVGAMFSSAALPMGQAHLTTNATNKGERLGYFVAAQSAGWFCGSFISGALYDYVGMRILFIFAAVLSLGAILSCAALIHDIAFNEVDKSIKRGYQDLLRREGMGWLAAAAAFSQIGMNAVSAFIAIMIVDELGGSTAYVGYANAATSLMGVLITGQVGKFVDRGGPYKALILAYTSYVAFAFFFGIVKDPVAAALLWALPIYPLSATATAALAARISGEDERGRAMSLIYGAQNAGGWIGPLIGGLFAEYVFLSVQPISFLNMALNIIALLIAVLLLGIQRSRRRKELVSDFEPQTSAGRPAPE